MTREELREKVARAMFDDPLWQQYLAHADAAIAVVLEEAAQALPTPNEYGDPWDAGYNMALEKSAAAIRALKGEP